MTAVVDARVVGMASIDARTHLTPGYWWHNYRPKLFKAKYWVSWMRLRTAGNRPPSWSGGPDDPSLEVPTFVRMLPPRDERAADLRTIAARRVNLFYLFTDGL